MTDRLPLFPLRSVLFPGLVLPLLVFEERYRRLVRDLIALPPDEPRRFGVVAIRAGAEAGDPSPELYDVGCTAEIREIDALPDGRFRLVTVGGTRFRLRDVDSSRPYLVGEVSPLGEEVGDTDVAAVLAARVRRRYARYLRALLDARGEPEADAPELPDEPLVLSYVVPATALLLLEERQALLAAPDVASRLRAALPIVNREVSLLERLRCIPALELYQ